MNQKTILRILLLPWIPLSVPVVAMLFKVGGWAWGPGDFIVMWVLMSGAGFAYVWITRKSVRAAYRVATGLALVTGFFLVWINGAVGIIGDDNPANVMYGGVLAVGLVGAGIARLRPDGMARALFATALAQFLVPGIALIFWKHNFAPGVLQVVGLNACFVALFVGSGLLFQHAARQPHALGLATAA